MDQTLQQYSQAKKEINKSEKIEWEITPIGNIANTDYGDYCYLVDNLIPAEGITIISASPKSGKSFLTLHIINQIARGGKCFDKFETTKGKVLLVDEENSERGLQRRIKKMYPIVDMDVFVMSFQGFKLDDDNKRQKLIDYIKTNDIKLVVFDSFIRIHSMQEKDSEASGKLYDMFKDIMKQTKCAILLIHHNRKLQKFEKISIESIRGSIDFSAMSESILMIESKPLKDVQGNRTTIYPVLRESIATNPFNVEWFDNESGTHIEFEFAGEVIEKQKKIEEAIEILKKLFSNTKGFLTIKEILSVLISENIGRDSINSALKNMETLGLIDAVKGSKIGNKKQPNTYFYMWKGDNYITNEANCQEHWMNDAI